MNTTPKYTAALNGLTKISSGPDHVAAVVGLWGDAGNYFKADLTWSEALALATRLNGAAAR